MMVYWFGVLTMLKITLEPNKPAEYLLTSCLSKINGILIVWLCRIAGVHCDV